MPNAEGRMEDDVQAALDLFSKSVAFGLLRPYPPEEAAWRTIHAALAAARAENEALTKHNERTCQWRYMDYPESEGDFATACGEAWTFTAGGIAENNARFCFGCGGRVIAPERPAGDDEDDDGRALAAQEGTR